MNIKSKLSYLRIFFIGFCMGIADLIPGVSGGTIAFITGIYDHLLNGIKSFDLVSLKLALQIEVKKLWERIPFLFLIPLGLGLISAVLTLSHLLESLFQTHPDMLWSFFFGLILGSIFILHGETRPWNLRDCLVFLLSTIFTFWLVGLPAIQTPPTPIFLFLAGSIAISAMILPGISGSYILVILGKYQQVLSAINTRDFVSLAFFLAGMVVGILSTVRIVSWLLQAYRHVTMIALTGIMTGALRTVWPWKETIMTRVDSSGATVPVMQRGYIPDDFVSISMAVLLLLLGAGAVVLLNKLKPPIERTAV